MMRVEEIARSWQWRTAAKGQIGPAEAIILNEITKTDSLDELEIFAAGVAWGLRKAELLAHGYRAGGWCDDGQED
jgi:hypothetical protein